MARRLIALGVLGLLLSGCVARDQYEAIKMERNALAEQLGTAQSSSAADRAAADAWKSQQERLIAAGDDRDKALALANKELAEKDVRMHDLQAKYEAALNNQGQIVMGNPLSPEINRDISALAEQSGGAMTFDPRTGTVKLKSDLTFGKGSSQLTPQVKHVVDGLATILNSPAAKNYELLVAGHTDNTPVSNPATIAAGNTDNMFLSSHRAISVAKELMAQHVSAQRIGYVGFGDQRPVASNATTEGQSRNRRVEIMISPTTLKSSPGVADGNTVAPTAPKKNVPILNKDSITTVDQKPILTK